MQLFKKILFPVDLSEVSNKMAPYVRELAKRFEAEIHVLFVARVFDYFTSIYVPHPSINSFQAEIVKGAEKKLQEFMADSFGEGTCKGQIIAGDAGEEIIKYAETQGMDLIIIGTHGRKGLERVIFGSVAEWVVRNSPIPVLTIDPMRAAAAKAAA